MSILDTIAREYPCQIKPLFAAYGEEVVTKYSDSLYRRYCNIFSQADYLVQVEWVLRCFNAAKRIVTSSLFYNQAIFLADKKCRNLVYHNQYYSLLHAFLANLYQRPEIELRQIADRNTDRLYLTHDRVLQDVDNYFIRFGLLEEKQKELLSRLRLIRETYSYHLPLSGSFLQEGEPLDYNKLMVEVQSSLERTYQIADLMSYLAFYAWQRKAPAIADEYGKRQMQVDDMFFSFIEHRDKLGSICLIDNDDYQRQGWAVRNFSGPIVLSWVITENICEDLECGWEFTDEERSDSFDITSVGGFVSDCIG